MKTSTHSTDVSESRKLTALAAISSMSHFQFMPQVVQKAMNCVLGHLLFSGGQALIHVHTASAEDNANERKNNEGGGSVDGVSKKTVSG